MCSSLGDRLAIASTPNYFRSDTSILAHGLRTRREFIMARKQDEPTVQAGIITITLNDEMA